MKKETILSLNEIDTAIEKVLTNACELIEEAKLIFNSGHYARAFALSHLAREEMAKTTMLRRVGLESLLGQNVEWGRFWERFRDHKAKIKNDAVSLFFSTQLPDDMNKPELLIAMSSSIEGRNDLKNRSLYVSYISGEFKLPSQSVTRKRAATSIKLAELLYRDYKCIQTQFGPLAQADVDKLTELKQLIAKIEQLSDEEIANLAINLQGYFSDFHAKLREATANDEKNGSVQTPLTPAQTPPPPS